MRLAEEARIVNFTCVAPEDEENLTDIDKQNELARMLNMKPGTIWAWEKGTVDFTMGKFGQVLTVLDINILEYIDTDYVTIDDKIEIKIFWKFVNNLMKNKQWINNGNTIENVKFEMCKELVNLVSEYVDKF